MSEQFTEKMKPSGLNELIELKEKFDKKYEEKFKVTSFIRPVNPQHLQMFFRCASSRGAIGDELADNSMIKKYVETILDKDEFVIYIIPTWEIIHLFDGTIEHTWMPLDKFLSQNSLEL